MLAGSNEIADIQLGVPALLPGYLPKENSASRAATPITTTNLVPIEHEIHLPQAALGSALDRVAAAVQFGDRGVLDEGLPPDFDERLFERRFHGV